eukprot:gene11926-15960_t
MGSTMGNTCERSFMNRQNGIASRNSTKSTTKNEVETKEFVNILVGENGEFPINEELPAVEDKSKPIIKLLPHTHTLFCERKQRVCTSAGRMQEMEILKVEYLPQDTVILKSNWLRFKSLPASIPTSQDDYIIISDIPTGILEYQLRLEDVNYYIGFRYEATTTENAIDSEQKYFTPVGPVLPGPPRLLDIKITGEPIIGSQLLATTSYIGGVEGTSEFWWMRVTPEGKRVQLTEPKKSRINDSKDNEGNARYYKITEDDIGCQIKVKCRPERDDGFAGEIFTSKSYYVVQPGTITADEDA